MRTFVEASFVERGDKRDKEAEAKSKESKITGSRTATKRTPISKVENSRFTLNWALKFWSMGFNAFFYFLSILFQGSIPLFFSPLPYYPHSPASPFKLSFPHRLAFTTGAWWLGGLNYWSPLTITYPAHQKIKVQPGYWVQFHYYFTLSLRTMFISIGLYKRRWQLKIPCISHIGLTTNRLPS